MSSARSIPRIIFVWLILAVVLAVLAVPVSRLLEGGPVAVLFGFVISLLIGGSFARAAAALTIDVASGRYRPRRSGNGERAKHA